MFSYSLSSLPALWWAAAFLTGLAGSLHCVGMCGPLAMALPLGRLPAWQRPWGLLTYHLGRLTSYATLGAIAGSLGQGVWVADLQAPVSIGAGGLLVIWGLSGKSQSRWSGWLSRRIGFGDLMRRLLTHPHPASWFGMGVLNGLLPCGLIYTALTGTLVSASPWMGMGYMVCFGLGTLPALLGVRALSAYLTQPLRRTFSRALPVTTVFIGALLLIRGLSVSPYFQDKPADQKPIPLCHG